MINANELQTAFMTIIDETRDSTPFEKSLSKMSSLPRKEWDQLRHEIRKTDQSSLEKIEGAILHVCLDDTNKDLQGLTTDK